MDSIKHLVRYFGGSGIELHNALSDGTMFIPGNVWIEVSPEDYVRLLKGPNFEGYQEGVPTELEGPPSLPAEMDTFNTKAGKTKELAPSVDDADTKVDETEKVELLDEKSSKAGK